MLYCIDRQIYNAAVCGTSPPRPASAIAIRAPLLRKSGRQGSPSAREYIIYQSVITIAQIVYLGVAESIWVSLSFISGASATIPPAPLRPAYFSGPGYVCLGSLLHHPPPSRFSLLSESYGNLA
jgi:hypothetical protein